MKHPESSGALPVAAIPPSLCVAEVRHGDFATRYRAGGQGRPVVLLAGAEPVPAAALLAGLVPRFRVLLPEAGVGMADAHAFRTWLRGFLDGLGLEDVALVALPAAAVNALAFTLVEPDRVSRLALAALDAAAATDAGPITDRLVAIDTPLLLVRHDGSREAACAAAGAVIEFLAGDAP